MTTAKLALRSLGLFETTREVNVFVHKRTNVLRQTMAHSCHPGGPLRGSVFRPAALHIVCPAQRAHDVVVSKPLDRARGVEAVAAIERHLVLEQIPHAYHALFGVCHVLSVATHIAINDASDQSDTCVKLQEEGGAPGEGTTPK